MLDKAEPWPNQWERGREPKWGWKQERTNGKRAMSERSHGRKRARYMKTDKKYTMKGEDREGQINIRKIKE